MLPVAGHNKEHGELELIVIIGDLSVMGQAVRRIQQTMLRRSKL